jgi:hypothetical protein
VGSLLLISLRNNVAGVYAERLLASLENGVVGGVASEAVIEMGIDVSLERHVGSMRKASNFS